MIFLTSSLKIDGINVRGGEFALPVYVQKMSASIKNVKLLAKYLRFDICQAYIPHAKKNNWAPFNILLWRKVKHGDVWGPYPEIRKQFDK